MKIKDLVLTGLCAAVAAILLPACSSMDVHGGAGVSVGSRPAVHAPGRVVHAPGRVVHAPGRVVHAPGPVVHTGGPPDHAPAHGYRKKHHHHDVELVYDSRIGVYLVAGHDGLYFHGDYFYRTDNGGSWRVSLNLNGPWEHAADRNVPAGLYKHGKSKGKPNSQGKAKGKGKGKGRGNA